MATNHPYQRSQALTLIRQAKDLLQKKSTILASPDDCDYFRTIYRSLKEPSINKPSQVSADLPLQPKESPLPIPETQVALQPIAPSNPIPEKTPDSALKTSEPTKESPLPNPETQVTLQPMAPSNPIPEKTLDSAMKTSEPIIENPIASIANDPKPKLEVKPKAPDLESMAVSHALDNRQTFEDLHKIISKIYPDLLLLKEIPSDTSARKIADRWKTKNQAAPISILSFHELAPQHQFLVNLTQALDVVFGQTRLITADGIEKNNQWETFLSVKDLKLVILCDYALWQMPNLLQFYRENPNRTERLLLNTQVMLLPDLSLYLKDPQLKRSLWKALCLKVGSI